MLNKVQKLLAWVHLVLAFVVMIGIFFGIFNSPGDDFYFIGEIVLKPETGLIYDLLENMKTNYKLVGEERLTTYLHMAYIGGNFLIFFMLVMVLLFPGEDKEYVFGKDGVKFNSAFYAFLIINSTWVVAFFELEHWIYSFFEFALVMGLYYSVYPVLKANETSERRY